MKLSEDSNVSPSPSAAEVPRWAPFAAVGVAFTVVLGLTFLPRSQPEPTPPASTSTSTSSSTSTTSTTVAPTSTVVLIPPASLVQPVPEVESTTVDDTAAIHAAAMAFVAAWLTPGTVEERTAALAPVTSPTFLPQLVDVDPANLPAATLASVGSVDSDGYRAVTVATLSNGQTVTVNLAPTAAGWRVSGITPGGK